MRILLARHDSVVDSDGQTVATMPDGNPLADDWDPAATVGATAAGTPLILWSGTCAPDLFEGHPRTWGAPGWEGLDRICTALAPGLAERDTIACFRPHARHVLSDAPSCRRFLQEHGDGPFGLALAPALMLEPSMLPEIEDHLTRIFELVGREARFLFLDDVVADGDACRAVPLGEGVMPRERVLGLIERHVPAETPIVLSGGDIARQSSWLPGREEAAS